MASIPTDDEILRGTSTKDPKARAMILGTCRDIVGRIRRNMERMKVSPHGKVFSGDMERNIYWAAYTGSGGDIDLAAFYVMEYMRFEEYAVQKGYKLTNGGKPSQITQQNYPRIAVDRRRGKHKLTRKAAPLIFGELLVHGSMLQERLATWWGNMLGMRLISKSLGIDNHNQTILRYKHGMGYGVTTDNTGIGTI